jgi:SnoaL-like protein
MKTESTQSTADRLAIIETLSSYAWGYDSRDLRMLGDSFSKDASFTIHLAGTEGWGPYTGRSTIVDWLASVMKTQTDQRRHCLSNLRFEELGDSRAVVVSFLTLTAAEHGKARLVTTGWYRDELINEDGVWRVSKKDLHLDAAF